jgi:fibronectin type 3 domain-containing protein
VKHGSFLATLMIAAILVLAPPAPARAADAVLYAAGDIACSPADLSFNGGLGTPTACRQQATADLMADGTFDTVLALGDLQYDSGSLSNFLASYDLSWGRVKSQTHPVIGNHEGVTATSGTGYCSYFGAAAHCNSSGRQGGAAFYSFDVGDWHVVVLNSNCDAAGGCGPGTPQYEWLQEDLDDNHTGCSLAAWHHPRWSSGHDGSNVMMQPLWQLFAASGGDLVLAGHSHDYERFAPIDANGAVNAADGTTSFVVGTGGANFTGIGGAPEPGSQVRQNSSFGVLRLALHPTSYDWRFVPAAGSTFTDSGTRYCRGFSAAGDIGAPSVPAGVTATASAATRVGVAWDASTDNVGVAGYEVLRATGSGSFVQVAQTTGSGLRYTDRDVEEGQTYLYRVRARDAAGNESAPSAVATVTMPDTVAPSAPAGVRAAAGDAKRVTLTWAAATDNVAVAGYEIWRGGPTGALTRIAVEPGGGTSYADTTVAGGRDYRYEVVAYDTAGNRSDPSAAASARTPAARVVPPPVVVPSPVVVTPPTATNLLSHWRLGRRTARRSLARGWLRIPKRATAPAIVRVRVGGGLAARRRVDFRRAFRIRLAPWTSRRSQRGRTVTVTIRRPRTSTP